MSTRNTIEKAIQMINSHDWFWMMCDYGYETNYSAAKAGMRSFVALIKTIDNTTAREALKNLWLLHYEHAHNSINGRETEAYEGRKDELMKIALAA